MKIFKNIKKATNYILFEEDIETEYLIQKKDIIDDTENSDPTEAAIESIKFLSEPKKTLKECLTESLKMSFVGDAKLSGWRDYVYYFTYCPFYNTKNGFEPVNTEGMTEHEILIQEAKKFEKLKTSKLIFDWINFILFCGYRILWFAVYNPLIACTEFPIRFLERVLLNKFKQKNISKIAKGIYGTLFAITKLLRVIICMVTSPLQNIKDALSLKEEYPKIAKTLAVISGIVSTAVTLVSLFASYGLSLKWFGTSLGSYIFPRLVQHPIRLTFVNTGFGFSYSSVLTGVIPKGSEIWDKIKTFVRNNKIYNSINRITTLGIIMIINPMLRRRPAVIITEPSATVTAATVPSTPANDIPILPYELLDELQANQGSTARILAASPQKSVEPTQQTTKRQKEVKASTPFPGISLHTSRTLTPGQLRAPMWFTPILQCSG